MKISNALLLTMGIAAANTSHGKFFVDYQGLKEEKATVIEERKAEEEAKLKEDALKSDYVVLADKSLSVLEQIGDPNPSITSVFGADMTLKDAMIVVMPEDWIAYIHKEVSHRGGVDFEGTEQPWTKVLANIGINHGYRFIVDWNKQQIQVIEDPTFRGPDFDAPVTYQDAESGKYIYVYSEDGRVDGESGTTAIEVDGKKIPVRIK